ncbi:MAG: CYTH domain-containing protein [Eubacterium sp.]|nr:CYTH domain-containing protein [Eubacterium sp.]
MEIERKFLIKKLPEHINSYPCDMIRQAYICTDPVIRIRQKNDQYILTVKSSGLLARKEVEFPFKAGSFMDLMKKADGNIIEKKRYRIPEKDGLTIELDIFQGVFEGFIMAEVEFPDLDRAAAYTAPPWFGKEVTKDSRFHNSALSRLDSRGICEFLDLI